MAKRESGSVRPNSLFALGPFVPKLFPKWDPDNDISAEKTTEIINLTRFLKSFWILYKFPVRPGSVRPDNYNYVGY
jgi:hypothetical protein